MHLRAVGPGGICVCIAVSISAAGCALESKSAARWQGIVRDSAGILLVDNNDVPLWREEDRWTLSEVLRIGTLEGEPEYQFGNISGFAPLSDGRIAITDDMAQNLRFFSPGGVHLRTVGRAGSGPAEFGPNRLSVMVGPGDTLLVMDWGNMRTHVFDPAGEWLESWRFGPEGGRRVNGWDTTPSGLMIHILTPLQTPDTPASDTLDIVVIRGVRGQILDTLAWLPSSRYFTLGGGTQELRFYTGAPEVELRSNGGLVAGHTDRYRLQWYDSKGNLERIVTLRRDPIPFDDHEQTACLDLFESVWKRWDLSPERISFVKSTIRFEQSYPAYRRLEHGPRGTLWVQQVRPTSDLTPEEVENEDGVYPWPYGSPKWDVFDQEGRYLGVVDVPRDFGLVLFYGDKMYGQWKDELDVQYLVVMEVAGLPPLKGG